ncbi:MAG: hypothetical protein ACRDT2_22290 [Natronosporangium sp.]
MSKLERGTIDPRLGDLARPFTGLKLRLRIETVSPLAAPEPDPDLLLDLSEEERLAEVSGLCLLLRKLDDLPQDPSRPMDNLWTSRRGGVVLREPLRAAPLVLAAFRRSGAGRRRRHPPDPSNPPPRARPCLHRSRQQLSKRRRQAPDPGAGGYRECVTTPTGTIDLGAVSPGPAPEPDPPWPLLVRPRDCRVTGWLRRE